MNKRILAGVLLIGATCQAQATDIGYSHSVKSDNHQHADKVGISHKFGKKISTAASIQFVPADNHQGDPGHAFQDLQRDKVSLSGYYELFSNKKIKVAAGLGYSDGDHKHSWKPALKASWKLDDDWKLSARYRYIMTHYDDKPSKYTNSLDLGVEYTYEKWSLGYKLAFYDSNTLLYDKGYRDHEHKVSFKYDLAPAWTPFFTISDISVSKKTDQRQQKYALGIKYSF